MNRPSVIGSRAVSVAADGATFDTVTPLTADTRPPSSSLTAAAMVRGSAGVPVGLSSR